MQNDPSVLTIHLFGPLRVLVHGEPLSRMRTRSVEWLLALLVLRHDREVNRSWLAGTLWPDSAERRALANLRDDLVRLRKALGSENTRLQSPSRATLTLDLKGAEVDLLEFDRAIQVGGEESLRRAVALYTGPLLEGCDEAWAVHERDNREQACLLALETLAGYAEQRGDWPDALALLRRAEEMDSLHDSIQRRRMRVLAASGDVPAALLAYREHRLRLRREMNLDPDAETILLFQQLRGADRGRSGKSEGETRKPEPPSPQPPTTEYTPLAPLPHPLTQLIGREEAVREVVRQIAISRLVTLVGTGGVGKTRLCIQAAQEAAEDFPRGAVFVGLASLSDPVLLPSFVASALGLREEGHTDESTLSEALVGWFSRHDVLLVLDNCEHLIEATAALTQRLLERCPRLHVLATSRQRLGLTGEIAWRVPSLPSPALTHLPSEAQSAIAYMLDYPAVQLFVERARMVRGEFRLVRLEEAQVVARICERLDGIPLALEMAAVRVRSLSVQDILARLEDRFRLLTEGSRGVLARHQTLRALMDWSYDLLDAQERVLLHHLCSFAGGWTLESAEAVFEAGSAPLRENRDVVLNVLASLEDKSLVLVEEQSGGLRYRMLETVREYGREKFRESGEEEAVRQQHADHFLALAEQAQQFLIKPEPAWLNRLESEHDNLRTALTYYSGQEATVEKAVRLVVALESFWSLRGYMYERRAWLLNLSMRSTPPTEARAQLLAVAGWLLESSDGNSTVGKQYFAESLAIMRRLEDKRGIATALNRLAVLESEMGESRGLAEESLALMREIGDQEGIADSLYHLGLIAWKMQDYNQARVCWMECRVLYEGMGLRGGLVLCRLGELALVSDDYAAAHRLFGRFVTERDEIGDRWSVAWGLKGLGNLALVQGRWEQAAVILGASFALKESIGKRLSDAERAPYDAMRSTLMETVGEALAAAAWEDGRTMTYDEAIQYALQDGTG